MSTTLAGSEDVVFLNIVDLRFVRCSISAVKRVPFYGVLKSHADVRVASIENPTLNTNTRGVVSLLLLLLTYSDSRVIALPSTDEKKVLLLKIAVVTGKIFANYPKPLIDRPTFVGVCVSGYLFDLRLLKF